MHDRFTQGFAALKRIPDLPYEYSPRTLVYQYKKIKLYHYHPKSTEANATPLLVVFATVNRPEVLDLFPETSFIGNLLEKGLNLYLVDWGYPKAEDAHLSLDDYMHFLQQCVTFIVKKTKQPKINLLGVCQGGIFSLCYAALFEQVKNLVLISTPIDFHTRDNLIAKLLSKIDINAFSGNIAGVLLTQFFISMRPFDLIGKKYLRFMDNLDDEMTTEKFLRVEKWLYDAPDQAGTAFKEFISHFYQQNKLIKGEIKLAKQQVNLKNLTMPILNVMARNDEIVPMSASRPLKKYVGSTDYVQRTFTAGHIGIYVSNKVRKRLANAIAAWLLARG